MRIGTVREIWRFPVKSMGGERVDATTIGQRGVHGDRLWAIRDEERGVLTNAKRVPKLLMCTARFVREPDADVGPGTIPNVAITFPDGSTVTSTDDDVDERLSAFVDRRVTLHALRPESDRAHYKSAKSTAAELREVFALEDGEQPDFSMMPVAKLLEFDKYATPPGTYFDAMPLHVLTTASLGDFDLRRFRANVVIDTGDTRGYFESSWTGATLWLGRECSAFIDCPTPRCSMPTRAQPDLPADKTVLKAIARDADRCLGAYATVNLPGAVRVGDDVTLEPPETSKLGDWARARATGLKRMLIRAAMPK